MEVVIICKFKVVIKGAVRLATELNFLTSNDRSLRNKYLGIGKFNVLILIEMEP